MAAATIPAYIDPRLLYRLSAAKKAAGWGAHKMRAARKKGLRVRYEGRHAYVRGSDLIAYIEANSTDSKPGSEVMAP